MNFGMVLATQRSGTNALRSILRNCEGVRDLQEILSGGMADGLLNQLTQHIKQAETFVYGGKDMTAVFDAYFQKTEPEESSGVQLLLIDCKYNAFSPLNPAGWSPCREPYFLNYCVRKKFRILHLVRENVLDTYISSLRVRSTGEWHWRMDSTTERHGDVRVEIKLPVLKEELLRRLEEIALFRRYLAAFPAVLEVTYDSLLLPETLQTIGKFFGVAIQDEKPRYEKIIKDVREMIVNYDQVEQFIRDDPDLSPALLPHLPS